MGMVFSTGMRWFMEGGEYFLKMKLFTVVAQIVIFGVVSVFALITGKSHLMASNHGKRMEK